MTQNLGLLEFIEPEPFSFPLGSREGSGYENGMNGRYKDEPTVEISLVP